MADGALLMRGVPMLVLSAQWGMSASLGVPQGELFGLCLLVIGSALIFCLRSDNAVKSGVSSAVSGCFSAVAVCAAALSHMPAIRLADGLLIAVALLLPDFIPSRFTLKTALIGGLLLVLPPLLAAVFSISDRLLIILQPLAAVGIIATALSRLGQRDRHCSPSALLGGMIAVLLCDILC